MRWIIAAAMIVAPSQGLAAPVYLDCAMSNAKGSFNLEIALDEAIQSATISSRGARDPITAPAIFTADKVQITREPFTLRIDRVSLQIVRDIHLMEATRESEGKCAVAKAPANRAF